jgi:hypothetical protein
VAWKQGRADDDRETKTLGVGGRMTHLTIAVEENLLEEAQERARQQGTSVEELLRRYLESFVDAEQQERQREAIDALLDLSSKTHSGSGGRKWTRDELYERKNLS